MVFVNRHIWTSIHWNILSHVQMAFFRQTAPQIWYYWGYCDHAVVLYNDEILRLYIYIIYWCFINDVGLKLWCFMAWCDMEWIVHGIKNPYGWEGYASCEVTRTVVASYEYYFYLCLYFLLVSCFSFVLSWCVVCCVFSFVLKISCAFA